MKLFCDKTRLKDEVMKMRYLSILFLIMSLLLSCQAEDHHKENPTVVINKESDLFLIREIGLDEPIIKDYKFEGHDDSKVIEEALKAGFVMQGSHGYKNIYSLKAFEKAYANKKPSEVSFLKLGLEGEAKKLTLIYDGDRLEVLQGLDGIVYFDDFEKALGENIVYTLTKGEQAYLLYAYPEKIEIDWVGLYIEAFEAAIRLDDALNDAMGYIAIDASNLDLTADDLERLMDYFNKYGVEVINESYQTLKEKGLLVEDYYIEGILLSVEKVLEEDKITLEVSKYKSALGAIGVSCEFYRKEGVYQLEDAYITWIS